MSAPGAVPRQDDAPGEAFLDDGSRVAVIGGGPAGSLFTYFLLEMAERIDTRLEVDIYEPKKFPQPGVWEMPVEIPGRTVQFWPGVLQGPNVTWT